MLSPVEALSKITVLERLHISNGYWRFRCPRCGDSAKHQSKTRGYLVEGPTISTSSIGCFNGCTTISFKSFIKQFGDADLIREVTTELFKSNEPNYGLLASVSNSVQKPEYVPVTSGVSANLLVRSAAGTSAEEYFESRRVYKGFESTLGIITDPIEYFEKDVSYQTELPVIIYKDCNNNHVGYLIRVGLPNLKYLADFKYGYSRADHPFGLERIDKSQPVIITEGEIDAMSINNGVALGTVGAWSRVLPKLAGYNHILYVDGDAKTNTQVKAIFESIIRTGLTSVFIPPADFKFKDANEALVSGNFTKSELTKYIIANSYSGLKLKLEAKVWLNMF